MYVYNILQTAFAMKRNTLLHLASLSGRLLLIFNILFFLGMTFIFIHVQVSPESYAGRKFSIIKPEGTIFYVSKSENWGDASSLDGNLVSLDQLTTASLYFNYLQIGAILTFTFLSIKAFLSVIRSVHFTGTFRSSNVEAFRKIGLWLLFVCILSGFSSVSTDFMNQRTYYLRITPLLLTLLSFIMAEIFKEGTELSEENQLTI